MYDVTDYKIFIFAAYGVSCLALSALLVQSLWRYSRARKRLAAAEKKAHNLK